MGEQPAHGARALAFFHVQLQQDQVLEPFGYHGGADHAFGRWRAAPVVVQQQAARAAIRVAQDLWLAVVGQQPGEGGEEFRVRHGPIISRPATG
ncbi:hypothetical protein [Nitratidesulfovibrio sp. D1]|uniref:hypothetical protein n=1 Tax=Nitratidesulfovibrio sp. D1 TaxID=3440151 RepID=UPI003EBAC0BF